MKFLVTGGAGFIGSHIVEELVRRKEKIRVLDNFSTGKRENIAPFLKEIELIEGDIRESKIVKKAMKGVDYVLHQAALPSVPRSIKDPVTTNEVNVLGTLNILMAAKEAGLKKVVYASSSSVYGDTPNLPKGENMQPSPLSPYALSKLAGEEYSKLFFSLYGLETIILRYFNVFGPRQDPTSQYAAVIPKFISLILKGERPTVYGDGEQSRDFTYVLNVVDANLLATTSQTKRGIFNIACGKRITVNKLVKGLNKIMNTDIEPLYTNPRPWDVKHSQADISKAKEALGYKIGVDFEEGLRKTVEWFRSQK
ncbi:SDR family oxidoreductase [bacterium]|nr:SDR family oxidoreductase [bacterium]